MKIEICELRRGRLFTVPGTELRGKLLAKTPSAARVEYESGTRVAIAPTTVVEVKKAGEEIETP